MYGLISVVYHSCIYISIFTHLLDCNVVEPSCSADQRSCEFDFNINHRFTMAFYEGDEDLQFYYTSKLVAFDGKLYKENCDGVIEEEPLSAEGICTSSFNNNYVTGYKKCSPEVLFPVAQRTVHFTYGP